MCVSLSRQSLLHGLSFSANQSPAALKAKIKIKNRFPPALGKIRPQPLDFLRMMSVRTPPRTTRGGGETRTKQKTSLNTAGSKLRPSIHEAVSKYPMLRNNVSGPEIGLPGRISADSTQESLKIVPPAGLKGRF